MRKKTLVLAGVGAGSAGGFLLSFAGTVLSPMLGLALLLGGIVAAAMFLWVDLAFLLTVAVIPIERLGRFADDSTMPVVSLMRIVGTVALGSFVLHAALRRWKVHVNLAVVLYSGYVAVCVLTIFYALVPAAARVHTATVLGNLLFLVLVVNAVRDWRMVRLSIFVWIGMTLVIALYQVYDWHFGHEIAAGELGKVDKRFNMTWGSVSEAQLGTVRQAAGTSSGAAAYGINLLMTVPFVIWLWRLARTRWQVAGALAALALILYNVLLTNSRAVLLVLALCLGLCVLLRLLILTPARLMLVLLGGVAVLAFLPAEVWDRALTFSNYLPENSYNLRGRFELWRSALRVIEDYWLTGVGGANWWILPKYTRSSEFVTDAIMSHNEYLQTFIDTGIVGWLFFIAFIVTVFVYASRTAVRLRRSEGVSERFLFMRACQVCLLVVYIFGLQVDVFHNPLKGWWLVAGLTCVMHRLAASARAAEPAGPPGGVARAHA
jgi:hypothetical protein